MMRELPNLHNLIERYRSGETLRDLASESGCDRATLREAFRRAGFSPQNLQRQSEVARRTIPNIEEIVARYVGGEPAETIALDLNIGITRLRYGLVRAGVRLRSRAEATAISSRTFQPKNVDDLIARYESGVSEKKLAHEFNVERSAIRRILTKAGVSIRGRSEAEFVKWKSLKQDRSAVERQCGAAWGAARGTPRTMREKSRRAVSWQRTRAKAGRYEQEIVDELRRRGLVVTHQTAIDHLNVDITLDEFGVAVEVMTSTQLWSKRSSSNPERIEHLFDRGWSVVFAHVPGELDVNRTCDELVSVLDRARGLGAGRRWYGVIRCDGHPTSRSCYEFNGGTFIA